MAAADADSTLGAAYAPLAPDGRLPPAILSNVPGTWAYDTVSRRLRETILSRIVADNADTLAADPRAAAAFAALDAELADAANATLRPIERDGGPDVRYWNESLVSAWIGKSWLDTPWLVSEFYFYRRVLEAIGYFGNGPGAGKDPFQNEKDAGLAACAEATRSLAPKLNAFANRDEDEDGSQDASAKVAKTRLFVLAALWGNRMDLSLWPATGAAARRASGEETSSSRAARAFDEALRAGEEYLLWDDSAIAARAILEPGCDNVGLVVDNAGFELVCDLALADAVVAARGAARAVVTLHVKAHPVFVSDAMAKDVYATIESMRVSEDEATRAMGTRWRGYVDSGAWIVAPRFAWAQPQPFWELPREARRAFAREDLVILKGDANYRRLLGDRLWELDTPFSEVASYFPTSLLALRTLKAELGCGVPKARAERAARENPGTWLTDGTFGVVQYLPRPAGQAHVANVAWGWEGPGSDPQTRKDLAVALVAVADACASVREVLAESAFRNPQRSGGDASEVIENDGVHEQLEVLANARVREALRACGSVRYYCSEEEGAVVELIGGGRFVVACDPLDGVGEGSAGSPFRTVFGVYRAKTRETEEGNETNESSTSPRSSVHERQVLRPGSELVASGYATYAVSTILAIAVAGGGAPTALRLRREDGGRGEFRTDSSAGFDGRVRDARARSSGTDLYRTLCRGEDRANSRRRRLLYECAALAFTAEAAGAGNVATRRILERTPRATGERVDV